MGELMEGRWYWVRNTPGGVWWPAFRDPTAAGGWTNQDIWEDFDNDVTEWELISLPKPERARLRKEADALREQSKALKRALLELRGERVLELRRTTDMTLSEIGKEYELSVSRVRQIIARAKVHERFVASEA